MERVMNGIGLVCGLFLLMLVGALTIKIFPYLLLAVLGLIVVGIIWIISRIL